MDVCDPIVRSESSVPVVSGLGSEGSLLCLCCDPISNLDRWLSFKYRASYMVLPTGLGKPLFLRGIVGVDKCLRTEICYSYAVYCCIR